MAFAYIVADTGRCSSIEDWLRMHLYDSVHFPARNLEFQQRSLTRRVSTIEHHTPKFNALNGLCLWYRRWYREMLEHWGLSLNASIQFSSFWEASNSSIEVLRICSAMNIRNCDHWSMTMNVKCSDAPPTMSSNLATGYHHQVSGTLPNSPLANVVVAAAVGLAYITERRQSLWSANIISLN